MYRHDYSQMDLFEYDIETKQVRRLTDYPFSDEKYALPSQSGDELLFVSDYNGINNIYKIKPDVNWNPTNAPTPVTNSLNGLDQISTSYDGKKLALTAMYKSSYNIFTLTVLLESVKYPLYSIHRVYERSGEWRDKI